jgi:sulfite oxidase
MAPFGKRSDMIVHAQEPAASETAPGPLAERAITATDAFYVRNHGPVPEADPAGWTVRVEGLVDAPLELSLAALRDGFAPREVVATLQCAGNRRRGLIAVRDVPGEEPWGPGAIGTATWRGVALADVLAAARPNAGAAHAGFAGVDPAAALAPPETYGASIPLAKAQAPEVVLAWEMNGEPLPPVHGGPLRVVVPGYIGARSVKWVDRVELRAEPWDGFFQATAYRLLPPDGEPAPGAGFALGEVALNSDVLVPADGDTVAAGPLEVRGYAYAGGGRGVARVDVSADGASWVQAERLDDLGPWAWTRWRARLHLTPGDHELVVRAWDGAAAVQPEHAVTVWNPKGYANTAWGRIRVRAQDVAIR